jgi:hypothetical protein
MPAKFKSIRKGNFLKLKVILSKPKKIDEMEKRMKKTKMALGCEILKL